MPHLKDSEACLARVFRGYVDDMTVEALMKRSQPVPMSKDR